MKLLFILAFSFLSFSSFAKQTINCEWGDERILTISFDEKDLGNLNKSFLKDTWNKQQGNLTSIKYEETNVIFELSAPEYMLSSLKFDKRNIGKNLKFNAVYVHRNPSTYSNDWSVVCSSSVQ